MKKIIVLIVLALMLTGCARLEDTQGYKDVKEKIQTFYNDNIKEKFKKDVDAHLSDGTNVIWSHNGTDFTENDLFEVLKAQSYEQALADELMNKFAKAKGITDEKINADVEESVKEILDQGYEDYINYYYGSLEEYKNLLIKSQVEYEYKKLYAEEKYDSYKNEKLPYKAQIAYFTNEDDAKAVLESVKNEEHTFEYAVQDKGYTSDVTATIYSDDDADLPIEVKEAITNAKENGLLEIVSSSTYATDTSGNSTVTPRYYVINLISKNADDFKDEFVDYIVYNIVDINDIINEDIEKNSLEVHDQTTYKKLSSLFDNVK